MIDNGGFTLNKTPAKQLGIQLTGESQRPILPPTADYLLSVPGKNGSLDFGADLTLKSFDLSCAIITKNEIFLQQAVSNLAAFLVDRFGKPRPLELVFDYQPDRKYYVRYSGDSSINRIIGLGRFALPLVAFDPHAYGLDKVIYQDVITSVPYPFMIDSKGNVSTPCVIELNNEGSETINYFKISIEYPVD